MNAQHIIKKEHKNSSRQLKCQLEYHYYPVFGKCKERENHPQEKLANTKQDLMSMERSKSKEYIMKRLMHQ